MLYPGSQHNLSIKEWNWLVPRGFRKRIVILRGYIDESYNDQTFTLSCLMSDPKTWMLFESSWKKCIRAKNVSLKKQGRKLISRYHAADCSSRHGEFEGWSVEEQIVFTKDLLGVIARAKVQEVFAYSIPLDDFKREFPDRPNVLEECYGLMFKFLVGDCIANRLSTEEERARKMYSSLRPIKVALIYERCCHGSVLQQAFDQLMADPKFTGKRYFSTLAPMSWEDCIPLQAADLWAYESFKEAERQRGGTRKRRKSLDALLENKLHGVRARWFGVEAIQLLKKYTTKPPS